MNLVKLKDTRIIYRNILHFYILISIRNRNHKNLIYNHIKMNKISKNTLTKEVKDLYSKKL